MSSFEDILANLPKAVADQQARHESFDPRTARLPLRRSATDAEVWNGLLTIHREMADVEPEPHQFDVLAAIEYDSHVQHVGHARFIERSDFPEETLEALQRLGADDYAMMLMRALAIQDEDYAHIDLQYAAHRPKLGDILVAHARAHFDDFFIDGA